MQPIVEPLAIGSRIDALDGALPQTQCRRCGYDDCLQYATAIAANVALTNRCPPGGADGVERLSKIAGTVGLPLDPSCGAEAPRRLAVIDENWCIGCALCLDACPVDAIVGAAKRMHTVIDAHCTGCELCIPVCPVDCISLVGVTGERTGWNAWTPAQADGAKNRYALHRSRAALSGAAASDIDGAAATPSVAEQRPDVAAIENADAGVLRRQAAVAAALSRARARRGE